VAAGPPFPDLEPALRLGRQCRESRLHAGVSAIRDLQGFARDSPLEEAVSSEPVSEVGFLAPGNYGKIPRRLWMITEAEKGHFGLEYAGILIFYPSGRSSCYPFSSY
jgi:hypothetical protein